MGATLFGLIVVSSLAVWTFYARQHEKAQKDMLMGALCQMELEASMAAGYSGATDVPPTKINLDASWTDVVTGETKPIEPSTEFWIERTVSIPEDGLKLVKVHMWYEGKMGKKETSLETLLYRTN